MPTNVKIKKAILTSFLRNFLLFALQLVQAISKIHIRDTFQIDYPKYVEYIVIMIKNIFKKNMLKSHITLLCPITALL